MVMQPGRPDGALPKALGLNSRNRLVQSQQKVFGGGRKDCDWTKCVSVTSRVERSGFFFHHCKAGSHSLKVPEGSSSTGAVFQIASFTKVIKTFTKQQHRKATANQSLQLWLWRYISQRTTQIQPVLVNVESGFKSRSELAAEGTTNQLATHSVAKTAVLHVSFHF